ncbi:MAG: hypothetical protein A2161_18045 [Candidatus Schekmanbacteria bacterium RBG_13_48_7]|uniref:Uncharacterized protein n=1 Tax=Candidatus Schekmanbacteria bacterium RBG_13_48_7 TaxID=1817878 RepID=A0A1F7RJK5_9BACT|nr:MAG: hypothetical protein A2161_18045 [Candidatus Schekmanbacteria bacterium RBG_13_48_7]
MLLFYFLLKNILTVKGRIIGLIMFVGYPLFLFYESQLLNATILTALLICLILLIYKNNKSPTKLLSAMIGITLGIMIIGRGTYIFYLPVILVFSYIKISADKRIKLVGIILLSTVAILLPVTIRNYAVTKRIVFLTTNSGINFFIGNNPLSEGGYVMLDSVDPDKDPSGKNFAESSLKRSLNEKEISEFWRNLALKEIRKYPGHYILLYLKKILLFFSGYEIPQIENSYYYRDNITHVLKYLPVTFPFIAPLAVLGMIVGFRKRGDLLLLKILLITHALSMSIFFVSSRYRLPVIPIFIVFAAYICERFIESIKMRKKVFCLIMIVSIAVLYFILNLGHPKTLDFSVMEYNLGVIFKDQDDFKTALQHLSHVNPDSPAYAESLYAAGICYQRSGSLEKARDTYLEAEKLMPARPEIAYNLGLIYDALDQPEKAIEAYNRSLKLDPGHYRSYNNAGMIYMKYNQFKDAEKTFLKAIELNQWYLISYMNLGKCYYMQHDLEAAARTFQEVIDRFPERSEGYQNYGIILMEMGFPEKAIAMIELAVKKNPEDPKIKEILDLMKNQLAGPRIK